MCCHLDLQLDSMDSYTRSGQTSALTRYISGTGLQSQALPFKRQIQIGGYIRLNLASPFVLSNTGSTECCARCFRAEPVSGCVPATAAELVLLAALAVGVEVPEGILLAAPRALDRFAADRDI